MRTWTLLIFALFAAAPAHAASPADSAAVARNEWRGAREARFRGESFAAMTHARRAHSAWPMQWYYAVGLASIAAEAGDPATAARALDDLTAMGIGMDVGSDSSLAAASAKQPIVAEAAARLRANLAPMAASLPYAEFPPADSAFWPEGIAFDGKTGKFYVASIRGHEVAVVDGGVRKPFVRTGALAAVAVAVDVERRKLWVTSAGIPQAGTAPGDTGRAVVEAFDLDTGQSLVRHTLPPVPGGHMPGDICVGPDGEVFISDSSYPAIYRIGFGLMVDEWVRDKSFRSLQGQAFSPETRTLYVADYSHGIAAIDVADRTVTWLEPPAGQTILGIDGMAIRAEELYAVQNGITPPRIVKLTLGNSMPRRPIDRVAKLTVLDRNVEMADEPTMGAMTKDAYVYVANSQWEKYDDAGARKAGTVLTPPRLLSVPLKKGKKK